MAQTIWSMRGQCLRKRKYRSEKAARQAANRLWNEGKRGAGHYLCDVCGGWHVTSRLKNRDTKGE